MASEISPRAEGVLRRSSRRSEVICSNPFDNNAILSLNIFILDLDGELLQNKTIRTLDIRNGIFRALSSRKKGFHNKKLNACFFKALLEFLSIINFNYFLIFPHDFIFFHLHNFNVQSTIDFPAASLISSRYMICKVAARRLESQKRVKNRLAI